MTIKQLTGGIVFLACFVMSLLYAVGIELRSPEAQSPTAKTHRQAEALPSRCVVIKVYDGDTIACQFPKQQHHERVRLLGINAPEGKHSYKNKTGIDEQYAHEASEHLQRLVLNKHVYLTFDQRVFDRYGRYLAYVYLDDSKTDDSFVNLLLLKTGSVRTLIIAPNFAHEAKLLGAEKQAQRQRLGLWRRQDAG